MSLDLKQALVLTCDGCGEEILVGDQAASPYAALTAVNGVLQTLSRHGWTWEHNQHWCPACGYRGHGAYIKDSRDNREEYAHERLA